jgi:drug/metabolite transporter (DMT)-like permease
MSYLFAVLAMLSIGTLGLLSKLADRRGYPPSSSTMLLFGAASAIMALVVLVVGNAKFAPSFRVILAAFIFGFLAVLAFWVFLFGLRFGNITTSWVFINLSAVIPALLSALIYHEKLGIRRICLLAVVAGSILLLWKERMGIKNENAPHQSAVKADDSLNRIMPMK